MKPKEKAEVIHSNEGDTALVLKLGKRIER